MISSSLLSSFKPFCLLRLMRLTPTPLLALSLLLLLSLQQQSLLFTTPFAFNSNSNNNNGAVIRKRTPAIVGGGATATATRLSVVSTTSSSSSSSSKSPSSASSSSSSLWLSSSLNEDEEDDKHQQLQQQREEEETNVSVEENGTNNNQFYSLRKVLGIDDNDTDDIDNNDSSSSSSSSSGFKYRFNSTKFPDIVGHRGCLYEELENTREGFLKCNEMGCDSIELDVFKIYTNNNNSNCSSSDNNITSSEIIVFHGGGTDESNPGDLLDYCGVEGSILDYNSIQDIQRLKFNSHHQEFQCPIDKIENGRIPTLRQVLLDTKEYNTEKHRNRTGSSRNNNSPDHMKIIIELKGPDISIVNDVLKLVEELNVTTICSYSSFDLQKLKLLRKLKPNKQQYRTCALYNNITPDGIILDYYDYQNQNILNCSIDCGVTDIHLKYDTCYKNLITKIHQQGFHTMGWMRGPIGMKHDILNEYNDYNNTGSSSSQCEDEDDGEENTKLYKILIQTGVQSLCINEPNLLIDMRNKYY